jgi:hypothetical protein
MGRNISLFIPIPHVSREMMAGKGAEDLTRPSGVPVSVLDDL